MNIRKLASFSLIGIGIFLIFYYAALLISMRMALPPWTIQTEGKYVAYGLTVWLYGLWMIPIGAILTLFGIHIFPVSSFNRKTLFIPLILGIGSLFALVYIGLEIIYSLIIQNRVPTLLQLFGGFAMILMPFMIVFLFSVFIAYKILKLISPRECSRD